MAAHLIAGAILAMTVVERTKTIEQQLWEQ